jgi:hypothetical protein
MLFEYAVEPQAIGSSWQNFRYLIEKFGFDRGRLISRFPKKWEREVYDSAAQMKPVERARLEIALKEAKRTKVVRSGRAYDPAIGSWLQNAITQHVAVPFHAIIAENNPTDHPQVVTVDEIDEQHALIAVKQDSPVSREAEPIAAALDWFLRAGARILFVDPYFDPYNARYKSTLSACLACVKADNPGAACEIHFRYHHNKPTTFELERDALALFYGVIPAGLTVTIFCWRQKNGGADFHARYLLTERGGVGIDAGFSAEGGHQTTDMHLMSTALSQARLNAFAKGATDFELVLPVIEIRSDGSVSRV